MDYSLPNCKAEETFSLYEVTVSVICYSRRKLAQHPLPLSITSDALPVLQSPHQDELQLCPELH